ncbi:MAG: bifunctional phosphoribosylaminoimidazolecarboxamide formyltransferase/IMP cyclohydrolase [Actinomycetota bacterium]|nr:bifunctional phosphoribosylaminoimidazolecarboxamide formyltransferase/IMP cyclohydrolase [Acidimicrobiales bacterium]MED5167352.1 bifunctional phosphoribosylaminoimidazolecarboxamide formyltransferase/IMP cyclohydrolase [Actinomycetota bacterium]MED6329735.1 bifunctional phosphoribosylaminoimidazolecarboxamide formyltransferase/IMP cyclohydrolase [Actinomycetota bacterium]
MSPVPKRALLSVHDKTGIADLARGLVEAGWELVSSGGTASVLADEGVPVVEVGEVTGAPEILGGRVKTLHPAIHGGILADRSDPGHLASLEARGIVPIDLVVGNLYPFTSDPGIELIDIGGPTMVRAAAKNHAHVGVVVDPADYRTVLDELRAVGSLSDATRRRLARSAFAHTAAYDAAIVAWFDEDPSSDHANDLLKPSLHLALDRVHDLRYGENPHQAGARYRAAGSSGWWDTAVVHGGKAMSYLNLFDTEAAWRLVHRLGDEPCAVVVKHANPCGAAVGSDIADAYLSAHRCDPVSAFGGVVAVNRPVTLAMAEALSEVFTEVVVAPAYEPDALALLGERKNLRVLEAGPPGWPELDVRGIDGGLLVQTADDLVAQPSVWRVVTEREPTGSEWADLEFAWRVVARVNSNAIVLVKNRCAVGIGAGQQNRRDAGRIAAEKAAGRAVDGACASDAFFPFRDGLDAVADAGVTAVVQPGGSLRDGEVVAAADAHGMAMVFTDERHFRH